MRILHTGDWHLGRTLEGRSRLPEQAAWIDELVDMAEQEGIDLVLVAGDVFDSVNPPAAAEELYYDALARLTANGQRAIVVIAGNHDNPDRLRAAGPLAARHAIHLYGLPKETGDAPITLTIPGIEYAVQVAALPYPSEARLNEVLTSDADDEVLQRAYSDRIAQLFAHMSGQFRADSVCLAMSHLFVSGGTESDSERPIQVGTASTVAADAMPAGAQYVALGHLHRPQEIRRAPVPTRYCGSPLAYSFSEAGQAKSVVIVDAEPGSPTCISELPVTSGRPLVRWRATEGLAQLETWIAEGRDATAWVDLELHTEVPLTSEQIRRLRAAREGLIHIRPVLPAMAEVAAASESRRELPVDELFRRFYQRERGALPDETLTRLFVDLVTEDEASGEGADSA